MITSYSFSDVILFGVLIFAMIAVLVLSSSLLIKAIYRDDEI